MYSRRPNLPMCPYCLEKFETRQLPAMLNKYLCAYMQVIR